LVGSVIQKQIKAYGPIFHITIRTDRRQGWY